ncbi:rod shape-determining protein MreD [Acidimicrobiales bacterium]|jgi:rod shape-determining protein MreD|nr:rod shape-determining protein MreD [Acidimicrobiaceae bacterium]MDB9845499.1 rod shape-determining protein MreD [Acidimicrobiales bacterium]
MRSAWGLRVVLIAMLVLIFHLDVSPDLSVAGVAAELPLGLAIAAGLAGGAERGAYFGFFFGFAVDLFFFTPIGLRALIFGIVGWAAGHLFLDRIEESPVMSAVAIGSGTALGLTAFAGLGIALGETALLESPITRIVLIASLINAVLAVLLMWVAHWMWAVDPMGQKRFAT